MGVGDISSGVVGGDGGDGGDGDRVGEDGGMVSDHSSGSVHSLAAPVQLRYGPHARAGEGGVVDGDMNGSGVTGVGVGGDGGVDRRVKEAPLHKTTVSDKTHWRPRVCNRVWKGKVCNNRSNGCRFAHPDPCNSSRCSGGPMANCKAFHPRVRGVETSVMVGNGKGSARKGGAAPTRNKRDGKAPKPKPRPNSSNSSSSNKRIASGRSSSGGNRNSGSNSNN